MPKQPPTEFRHRSSDPWEVAALYANGWTIAGTEIEDGRVVFLFPDGGQKLAEAVQAHHLGHLRVGSLALRQSYFHVRSVIDRELHHAGS